MTFTYYVFAEFTTGPGAVTTVSDPSDPETISAVNVPPLPGVHLVADTYTTKQGTTLVVPSAALPGVVGVLGNDAAGGDSAATPVSSKLRAVPIIAGTTSAGGKVDLAADGSFTYTPVSATFTGTDTFTYRANNGPWSDDATVALSVNSAPVTVTINVTTPVAVNYVFFNVQNAPPPAGKSFKAGSTVPMKWQYKMGSTVVDSSGATFAVTVKGPYPQTGVVDVITNTDSGGSSFRYDVPSKTWYFNLQTKKDNGANYSAGVYEVKVTAAPANFLPSPTFTINLAK